MRTPKPYYFEGGVINFSVNGNELSYTAKLWNDHGYSQYTFEQGKIDTTQDHKEQCEKIALRGITFRNVDIKKYGDESTFWMSPQEQVQVSRQVAKQELGS